MRPRADEVMQSIIWTYDEHILPHVQGDLPKSLALTVSNLLRHVALRMEREGPALIEDNEELRQVLGAIADYIDTLKPAPDELRALRAELLAATKPGVGEGYVGLVELAETAASLRATLDRALRALQAQRAALGAAPEYQATRQRIRDYLNHQLERQSRWIREAFTTDRR